MQKIDVQIPCRPIGATIVAYTLVKNVLRSAIHACFIFGRAVYHLFRSSVEYKGSRQFQCGH